MPLPSICRPPSPFIAGILFDLAPAIGLSGCPRLRLIDRVGIRWMLPPTIEPTSRDVIENDAERGFPLLLSLVEVLSHRLSGVDDRRFRTACPSSTTLLNDIISYSCSKNRNPSNAPGGRLSGITKVSRIKQCELMDGARWLSRQDTHKRQGGTPVSHGRLEPSQPAKFSSTLRW